MSNVEKLAKEIQKRNNKNRIGQQVGKVLSISPLKVSICDGMIILDDEIEAVCQAATFLKEGDEVLVEPNEDEQSFVVIDRVRKKYGPQIGTVKKSSPLTIELPDGKKLKEEITAVCVGSIEQGDTLLCIPKEGEEEWIIVGKVVR